MPSKNPLAHHVPRFNRFSVGRGAVLFRKGLPRDFVVEYYLFKYAENWGLWDGEFKTLNTARKKVEDYLFEKCPGRRPNFARMFESKNRREINAAFKVWLASAYGQTERMRALHADPEFKRKHKERSAERMRALHADPEFKRKHKERSAERMRALHADPEFKRMISKTLRDLWASPEWRENQISLIRSGIQRHWTLVRQGLLNELRARNLMTIFDVRKKEFELATSETPLKNVLDAEQQKVVQMHLNSLPDIEREAVVSTIFEGTNIEALAEQMALSTEEVDEILHSAYAKLARKLRGLL